MRRAMMSKMPTIVQMIPERGTASPFKVDSNYTPRYPRSPSRKTWSGAILVLYALHERPSQGARISLGMPAHR